MRIAFIAPWSSPPTVGAHKPSPGRHLGSMPFRSFQFSFDPVVEVPSIRSATKLVQFICSLSNLLLDILHGHNRWFPSDESGLPFLHFVVPPVAGFTIRLCAVSCSLSRGLCRRPPCAAVEVGCICTMSAQSPARAAHLAYLLHLARQEPSATTLWITATRRFCHSGFPARIEALPSKGHGPAH